MRARLLITAVKLISGASPRWLGSRPDVRQRIYFANHTSNLDALVLWVSLPHAVREVTSPVAARDYWAANAIRQFIATKIFNAVLIERKKVTAHENPMDDMLAALENKYSLIIFPEGGRSLDAEMKPFKSGLYHLAKKRPDIELIPTHIDNANRILPKGEVLPVPLLCCISFGAPMQIAEGENKVAFLERARNAVNQLHQA